MKRSEINAVIEQGKEFFAAHQFHLPPWAFWRPEDWKGKGEQCKEIVDNMLGWDLTDFNQGDFSKRGLLLFTVRNGRPGADGKTYCEKIMIVGENQETPMHFHWNKMEDIINRGGGNLVLQLYKADTQSEEITGESVVVSCDGITRTVESGGEVVLTPGESITLEPYVYHRFFGQTGKGPVLTGEVSAVNDDNTDNRFKEPLPRFPNLEEDEAPIHLLCSEYRDWL